MKSSNKPERGPYKGSLVDDKVAARAKSFRLSLGFTQGDVSEKIKITEKTISLIENGMRKPSPDYIRGMAEHFNMNTNWLFTGEGRSQRDLRASETSIEERVIALESQILQLKASVKDLLDKVESSTI